MNDPTTNTAARTAQNFPHKVYMVLILAPQYARNLYNY